MVTQNLLVSREKSAKKIVFLPTIRIAADSESQKRAKARKDFGFIRIHFSDSENAAIYSRRAILEGRGFLNIPLGSDRYRLGSAIYSICLYYLIGDKVER